MIYILSCIFTDIRGVNATLVVAEITHYFECNRNWPVFIESLGKLDFITFGDVYRAAWNIQNI